MRCWVTVKVMPQHNHSGKKSHFEDFFQKTVFKNKFLIDFTCHVKNLFLKTVFWKKSSK